jgi:DNA-binding transcriptional ArsR family regulator
MDVEEKFVSVTQLICEQVRAKMLWSLLDGRAYTASELAISADVSITSASNHLAKLLEADIIKVEAQGRHRYFSFSRPEVAYAVESLANLADNNSRSIVKKINEPASMKYCRTCYDHLAGFVGVKITEALEEKGFIAQDGMSYKVTRKGWNWFAGFGIEREEVQNKRRPTARQCLDWSERRPHLAGQLGAIWLKKMFEKNWFRKVRFSRELVVTSRGRIDIYNLLNVQI